VTNGDHDTTIYLRIYIRVLIKVTIGWVGKQEMRTNARVTSFL